MSFSPHFPAPFCFLRVFLNFFSGCAPLPICLNVTLIGIFRSFGVDGADLDVGGADERWGAISGAEKGVIPGEIICYLFFVHV